MRLSEPASAPSWIFSSRQRVAWSVGHEVGRFHTESVPSRELASPRPLARATWRWVNLGTRATTCLLALTLGSCSSEADEPGQTPSMEDSAPPDSGCTVPSGTFRGSLEVGLTTSIDGAELRYTLDGQRPTAESSLFAATPIAISTTTELRVQAFKDGAPSGNGGTCLYVLSETDASSNLPIVVIDGYGGGKPEDKNTYRDAAVLVFEPSGGNASLDNPATLSTRAGYHVRGQSSASFPKTPYRVEFRDETDADRDLPLLGMPSDSDWALISPYVDRALIRDAFVYSLGKDMGMEAPRFAYVELYLNYDGGPLRAEHYQGIYLLVETIKNSKERLDLEQLREDDTAPSQLSGGYIFKFDFAAAEEPIIECQGSEPLSGGGFGMQGRGGTCWNDLEVVDPDPLNSAQAGWLQGYVQSLHDALHEEPMGNWTDFADAASFVDNFIIQEFSRNMDAYIRSAYFHKHRDGKLLAGPLWDYNLTFDCGGSFNNRATEGWQYPERGGTNDWFPRLASNDAFMELVRMRYRALRQNLLSDEALDDRIDALSAPLAEAARRDFERWPIDEVRRSFFSFPEADTWEGQLDAIRSWMRARLAWLDTVL